MGAAEEAGDVIDGMELSGVDGSGDVDRSRGSEGMSHGYADGCDTPAGRMKGNRSPLHLISSSCLSPMLHKGRIQIARDTATRLAIIRLFDQEFGSSYLDRLYGFLSGFEAVIVKMEAQRLSSILERAHRAIERGGKHVQCYNQLACSGCTFATSPWSYISHLSTPMPSQEPVRHFGVLPDP